MRSIFKQAVFVKLSFSTFSFWAPTCQAELSEWHLSGFFNSMSSRGGRSVEPTCTFIPNWELNTPWILTYLLICLSAPKLALLGVAFWLWRASWDLANGELSLPVTLTMCISQPLFSLNHRTGMEQGEAAPPEGGQERRPSQLGECPGLEPPLLSLSSL